MGAFPIISSTGTVAASPSLVVSPSQPAPGQPRPAYLLGLVCTVSPGANLTYSVQVTADQAPSSGVNWNNHDTLNGLTSSANGNIAYPVTGIRLNVTAYTSGTVNVGIAYWP